MANELAAEVMEPSYYAARAAEAHYGVRIPNAGPFTLARCREILALLDDKRVPDDAQIQWSYPDVYASWTRHDPFGKVPSRG